MGDTRLRECASGTLQQLMGRIGAESLDKNVSYTCDVHRVFFPLGCLLQARALAELIYCWVTWESLNFGGLKTFGLRWRGSFGFDWRGSL